MTEPSNAAGSGPNHPRELEASSFKQASADEVPTDSQPKVGYRNTPIETRFREKSGNPRGRPKGSKNRKTIVREVANEMHTVIVDGKKCRYSTLELILFELRNQAMQGNVRAAREYDKLLSKYAPQSTAPEGGYLVAPHPITIEEAIAEGEKANAEAEAKRAAKMAKDSGTETPH